MLSPKWICSSENESILHFFLHCNYYIPIRKTLSEEVKTIDANLLKLPDCKLIMQMFPVWWKSKSITVIIIFFSIWVFFHDHSQITGLLGKGEGISLTPHYHFHPLHRRLDISWAITAEIPPLHIGSSWTWTRNPWFLSTNC